MIVNERITTYIHSLETDNSAFLEDLRKTAMQNGIPIIRREMESFLRVLFAMNNPETILEIGTAVGYSSIFMADCSKAGITTVENYGPRILEAKKNIQASGYGGRIKLLEGDAAKIIKTLDGPFDMVFLDGPKGQYAEMLPELMRLTKKGGIILADNVLLDGSIAESRYALARRQRTIHERMREFLYEAKHNGGLETSLITIGDGVALSVRK